MVLLLFLLDAQVDQTLTRPTFVLPSNMGEDLDVGLVQEATFGEGSPEGGVIEEQQPSPSSVPSPASPSPTPSTDEDDHLLLPSRPLPAPPLARNDESSSSDSDTDSDCLDTSLGFIGQYFKNRQSSNLAVTLGQLVEAVAEKLPYDDQLTFLSKITKIVEEMQGNNSWSSEENIEK